MTVLSEIAARAYFIGETIADGAACEAERMAFELGDNVASMHDALITVARRSGRRPLTHQCSAPGCGRWFADADGLAYHRENIHLDREGTAPTAEALQLLERLQAPTQTVHRDEASDGWREALGLDGEATA